MGVPGDRDDIAVTDPVLEYEGADGIDRARPEKPGEGAADEKGDEALNGELTLLEKRQAAQAEDEGEQDPDRVNGRHDEDGIAVGGVVELHPDVGVALELQRLPQALSFH